MATTRHDKYIKWEQKALKHKQKHVPWEKVQRSPALRLQCVLIRFVFCVVHINLTIELSFQYFPDVFVCKKLNIQKIRSRSITHNAETLSCCLSYLVPSQFMDFSEVIVNFHSPANKFLPLSKFFDHHNGCIFNSSIHVSPLKTCPVWQL